MVALFDILSKRFPVRSLLYSLAIGICLILFEISGDKYSPKMQIALLVSPFFILLFELYASRRHYINNPNQRDLKLVDLHSKSFRNVILFHHILLPLLLLIGSAGFIFFSQNFISDILIIVFTIYLLFLLFENFKAVYENNHSLEKKTHYVFDITKLVVFFLITFTSINIINYFNLSSFLFILTIFIMSVCFFLFEAIRKEQLNHTVLIVIISLSLLIGIFSEIILKFTSTNVFNLSLVAFISYYFLGSLLHHKLNGTLNKKIFFEYLILYAIFISLIYFMILKG